MGTDRGLGVGRDEGEHVGLLLLAADDVGVLLKEQMRAGS